MSDLIIVTASKISTFNYLPVSAFRFNYFAYTPANFAPGISLSAALQYNQDNGINSDTKFEATADTPEATIITPGSYSALAKAEIANSLGVLFSQAGNSPEHAAALAEMAAAGVKWNIQVVQNWSDTTAPNGTPIGNPNAEAVTYGILSGAAANGGHYAPGTVITTIVLAPYAIGANLDKVFVHELTHLTRGPDGTMRTPEAQVIPIVPNAVQSIYHPSRLSSPEGSISNSLVIQGAQGNSLIFGSQGNNIIKTGNGNNTVVVYDKNSYVESGYGNDYVQILGTGAKYLKDTGGLNTLYVSWLKDLNQLDKSYDENRAGRLIGAVVIAPHLAGVRPEDNPDRITIENFANSGYQGLAYTDYGGTLRTVNFSGIFPRVGNQIGVLESRIFSDSNLDQPAIYVRNVIPSDVDHVIGTPASDVELPVGPKVRGNSGAGLPGSTFSGQPSSSEILRNAVVPTSASLSPHALVSRLVEAMSYFDSQSGVASLNIQRSENYTAGYEARFAIRPW